MLPRFDDVSAMIQLLFAVRYQSQLRRVRPQAMSDLESAVVRSIRDSGGVLRIDGTVIRASFNEDKLAFWLDLIIAIDGVASALSKASKELYGSACLVHVDRQGAEIRESTLRELSRLDSPTGIWCDEAVSTALAPYASFGTYSRLASDETTDIVRPLSEIELSIPPIGSNEARADNSLQESIRSLLEAKGEHGPEGIILTGEAFRGQRSTLRSAVQGLLGSFPPYFVTFGSGGPGLACLADAIGPEVASVANSRGPRVEAATRTDLLKSIASERLRAEPPDALVAEFTRYLGSFAASYASAARARGAPAIFVLENIHKADFLTTKIAASVFAGLATSHDALVILTAPKSTGLDHWSDWMLHEVQLAAPTGRESDPYAIRLSDDLMEYLYALSLLGPLFAPAELLSLFTLEGKPPRALEQALISLSAAGAIEACDDPIVSSPDFAPIMVSRLAAKAERVRAFVRRRLLDAVASAHARPSFGLLAALSSLGGVCDDDLALDAVEAESGDGTIAALGRVFASERLKTILGKRIASLEYIARSRCALRRADESVVSEVFSAPFPEWFPTARYRAQALSSLAAFSLGSSDVPSAEGRAKEAILLLQDKSDSRGLSRAYRLLGLVDLAKERVSEAIDYFTFAQESSENSGEEEEAALDAAYASVAEFIWGNLAKAERLALAAEELAARAYRSDWQRWSMFFRGRLRFEAGCYRDAAELFDSLMALNDEGIGSEERRTVTSWAFRARVYNSILPPSGREAIEEDGDGGLFLLESFFFSKDYRSAISLADKLLSTDTPRRFSSPERPNWLSGFSLAEDLVLPANTARRRLVRMLRSLSMSAMGKNSPAVTVAVEELRGLVKDEKLSESDPYDAQYYMAYCQILEASGAAAVDVGTALSVAFKRVQRRASRIDDAEVKRSYLYLNRWNSALLVEAKTHNLI